MNYKLQTKKNNQRRFVLHQQIKTSRSGFTIIETMIAVALFLIVVLVGMDSLLNTTVVHKKSQDMRSIMDNLNFIMEDMSRNLRTGYNYICNNSNSPISCESGGNTITFEPANGIPDDDSDQWKYKITGNSNDNGKIQKTIDNGNVWVILTPSEIKIDAINSGFFVYGAEPPTSDLRQPYIIIRLVGKIISENGVETPFSLQTGISQRLIDNIIQ